MIRPALALLVLVAVTAMVAACGGGDSSGPPSIELGRDTCDQCHMIISELRYASAYRDANGKPFVFDDISEMLEHLAGNGGATAKTVWVHDYDTEQWIDAIGAWYVRSDDLRTPMGGGIVAFTDEADARAFATERDGEVLRWDALLSAPSDKDVQPTTTGGTKG